MHFFYFLGLNCTKCDYSTNANFKLNDHMKRCSLDGEIHKCQDCGYRSGTSYGLSKHRIKGKYETHFFLKLCLIFVKGQLISKCPFDVNKLTKKPTKVNFLKFSKKRSNQKEV
jgi:hypothetical protein